MTVAVSPRAKGFGNVRWMVVFWMFIVAAVSYLDRNNISIAAAAIQEEFGLSNVQLGGVFSAFVMGYALTQPIAGRIADRFGPYRVIAFGIIWWSLFTVATALVPSGFPFSLTALIAVRFLLGIGEAVIFPASNRLVANWIPAGERGLANGIIFAGVGIGAGIAPPLIIFIMVTYGWQWAFHASALIGLVVLAIWLLLIRDRPRDHPLMTQAELSLIENGMTAAARGKPATWSMIIRQKSVGFLAASYFAFGYVAYIFFTWFFLYLSKVRGLDLKASAIYGMLPFIAMALASPLGGWISDRLAPRYGERKGRCWTAAASLALAAIFVAAATQVDSAEVAVLFLAGGAGSLYLSQSAYWTLSANLGGNSAGSVSGFMNMCNQIAGILTASLTPFLADRYGWTPSFLLAAAICLCGAGAWLMIDPEDRLEA
ncbi:MFS transporter [Sphingobium boeckii]|uniref:ACS family glucarate transporter-like MFS transporter n=1 Tax=Sphingobium boeckii TaxID=1082345 RepID=A0A7W9EH49_9SPHN|nr:MFS transporter [Sphingobium boeckii]MBB5687755.1 ACS family glucarate transporter-like MFS transporter [Sphingobium boeckii]